MGIKYMRINEECPQCGCKLEKQQIEIRTEDGYKVCSNWCKDQWDLDTK